MLELLIGSCDATLMNTAVRQSLSSATYRTFVVVVPLCLIINEDIRRLLMSHTRQVPRHRRQINQRSAAARCHGRFVARQPLPSWQTTHAQYPYLLIQRHEFLVSPELYEISSRSTILSCFCNLMTHLRSMLAVQCSMRKARCIASVMIS